MGHNIFFDRACVETEYSLLALGLGVSTLSRCREWDILSPASCVEQLEKEEETEKVQRVKVVYGNGGKLMDVEDSLQMPYQFEMDQWNGNENDDDDRTWDSFTEASWERHPLEHPLYLCEMSRLNQVISNCLEVRDRKSVV